MKLVTVDKNFGDQFSKSYIPKLYVSLIKDELNKSKYTGLLTYLKEKLKITKQDILQNIKIQNVLVSQVEDNYVIKFRSNVTIRGISLAQLIDFMNDGNLSLRSYNLVNTVTDYINKHIRTIHRYYLMKGE